MIRKYLSGSFSDLRIRMNGINYLHIIKLVCNPAHGAEHFAHCLAYTLPSVRCQKYHSAVFRPFGNGRRIVAAYRIFHRIYGGVSRHEYFLFVRAFAQKIFGGKPCRRKQVFCRYVYRTTVELLRIRSVNIICAESRLNVSYGYLHIKAGKRRRKSGRRVAVNKYNIRIFPFKHGFQLFGN